MPSVQLELLSNWPTGRALQELFLAFGATALPPRISTKDGYGNNVTLTLTEGGDIGPHILEPNGKGAGATFVAAGGGRSCGGQTSLFCCCCTLRLQTNKSTICRLDGRTPGVRPFFI